MSQIADRLTYTYKMNHLAWSPSSATGLHAQIVLGESKHPRGADRPVSAGKTTSAAQRNLPRTLRTQEPRGSLGLEPSGFCLKLEPFFCYKAPYTNRAEREQASQGCR